VSHFGPPCTYSILVGVNWRHAVSSIPLYDCSTAFPTEVSHRHSCFRSLAQHRDDWEL